MRRECSWCGDRMLPDVEPLADTRTTHGICGPCFDAEMEKIARRPAMKWYESKDNVDSLAGALVEAGIITGIHALLWFYKHPQKFYLEWRYYTEHGHMHDFNGEAAA